MVRWVAWFGAGLIGLVAAVLVAQVLTLRTRWDPGVTAIRRLNRIMNRRQMKTAGRPGAAAAVIRHVGRKSGSRYETPVGVVESDDGFVVALPYGTSPDWLKNVMAAGSAEVVYEGRTFEVDRPEIVSSRGIVAYSGPVDRLLQVLYGVDQALRLRRADPAAG